MSEACPCGSGDAYDACCGRYLSGAEPAPTAEALMRSRYTAFVREDADYLRRSWHPATCPARIEFDPAQRWLGLKVDGVDAGGPEDAEGEVSFVARYKVHGRGERLVERSQFSRVAGNWVYVGRVV